VSSVQCELLGYCNCKQNVIRCQLGRRWGKWLGKSSWCTMRRHLPHLAFLLWRQGCERRPCSFDRLHVTWMFDRDQHSVFMHSVTDPLRVLSVYESPCHFPQRVCLPVSCSSRHRLVYCCCLHCTPTPIRDIWRLLCGHIPYLRNCVDGPSLVQVISRSRVLLHKLVVP